MLMAWDPTGSGEDGGECRSVPVTFASHWLGYKIEMPTKP